MSVNYVVNRYDNGVPTPNTTYYENCPFCEYPIVVFHVLTHFDDDDVDGYGGARESHINVCLAPKEFLPPRSNTDVTGAERYTPCERAILAKLPYIQGNVIQLNSRKLATYVSDGGTFRIRNSNEICFSIRTVQKAIKGLVDKGVIAKFNLKYDATNDDNYKDLYVINYGKISVNDKYYQAFRAMYDLVHFNKTVELVDGSIDYKTTWTSYGEVFKIKAKSANIGCTVNNYRYVLEDNHILLEITKPNKQTNSSANSFGYYGDKSSWLYNRVRCILSFLFKK